MGYKTIQMRKDEADSKEFNSMILFFLFGAVASGVFMHGLLIGYDLPKWALFSSIIIVGGTIGGAIAAFRDYIKAFITILIGGGTIAFLGYGLWSVI